MTPSEAWDAYVGNQSPAEFVRVFKSKGVHKIDLMCEAYAADLPNMFDEYRRMSGEKMKEVARLLARYVRSKTQ